MLLASLATSIYTVRTQHVCFGSMRLGNSHCSGLQEDDHAVSILIIAPCTTHTRLVGMIFDAAVSNCLHENLLLYVIPFWLYPVEMHIEPF